MALYVVNHEMGAVLMRRYRQIASKALKTKVMMENPGLLPYIPKTTWYTPHTLDRMLAVFPTVFIKPDKGGGGAGILRVQKEREGRFQICFRKVCRSVERFRLAGMVNGLLIPGKRYLIQQGIDLARIQGRPVDIRILLQKPERKWVISGMVAKVAAQGQFVTNHSKGGKPVSLEKAFALIWGKETPVASFLLDQLKELALRTAFVLDSRFPGIKELGIDVGADQSGRLWIFEVNTRPQFQMFRKVQGPGFYTEILKRHRQAAR